MLSKDVATISPEMAVFISSQKGANPLWFAGLDGWKERRRIW